ncbi:gliding motility-associated C-terminal domain-containing protein [Pedobacter ginsengisoli]|uniref:gliding motility-associated C-terminal domain-containing protein n=1 Tax=Pedobacter ginsengisoli TaxID=363852 RepID=UPI00254F5E62|nr:gliding motility-associated C-terminal domain-containing protein [Pedobacter ginsengisoli]
MTTHKLNLHTLLSILALVFIAGSVTAQVCTGSLGDPVVNLTFGSGVEQFGAPLRGNTYQYVRGDPIAEGTYTVVNHTRGLHPDGWHQIPDHTYNDANGYMMLINASDNRTGLFYRAEIPNLCPNTKYEFAAWINNLLVNQGIRPNVRFSIETITGAPLGESETGEIPEGSADNWIQYGATFTTGANDTQVILKIGNVGLGGGGNDFVIDDITFRPCGPIIMNSINGVNKEEENLCVGDTKNFTLSVEVQPGAYVNPQYLWQQRDENGNWTNLNRTTADIQVLFRNAQTGTYEYRALISELGNITSVNCRSSSRTFTIKVNPFPDPHISAADKVCIGDAILLSVDQSGSYLWQGPNGFTSTERQPVIEPADDRMTGTYKVTVTSAAGCTVSDSKVITIVPKPSVSVKSVPPICRGGSAQLEATGGISFRWIPATGLSATDIPNPIANPNETTTYTVFIADGACEVSTQVEVVVLEDALSDAGPDKKMVKGRPIILNGKSSGEQVRYFWTPADYLDDPNKLNPVANPPFSMVYTLNTVSEVGCMPGIDEVYVTVYDKVVVPNVFSPNGDGSNDVWKITAIDAFDTPKVQVMNRYGILVFESTGYAVPWDGKHKNADLPAGVYYYQIKLSNDLPPLSGSVTLIR